MQQRTPEWFASRAGKVTASRIADLTAKTKSGPSASRKNYMAELICERLTGQPAEHIQTAAMQRGTELEATACATYVMETGNMVEECGFIDHPAIRMSGASPDGLVGNDGLIEIKCPNTATHIEFLKTRTPPDKYIKQMQWQMACTGRQWCDFVSFDDRLPERLAYRCIRIKRDDALIDELEREVSLFLIEMAETIEQLEKA
ncbi:putative phage-type endonuclease [Neisseria sp. HSC-16F19]|nr:lambda exonuclease family protein [Neisseria sp. HSC-16F19]MCP2041977.1 putative phage-type endonuclease [Neisseria sp. HSC-16F19]